PSPYCDEYFEVLKGRISYIETSRGCPYSCAFCLSSRCGGVRYFDIERSKKEILALANSGSKTIKFVDRTFNANKKRANIIISFLKENYGKNIPTDVCFHFEIAGDILDDEGINLLGSLPKGFVQLEIGMQSFNEKTLAAINRKTDCKLLINNILRLTAFNNMHIHIDLIAGLPYEDLSSFKNSFNIAYSLNSQMLQLGFLKVLYGTAMSDFPEKFPAYYSKKAPYEVISTPWLSPEDIELLKAVEDSNERLHNSGRFKNTLNYVLKASDLTPFDLMKYIGKKLYPCHGISLDEYTDRFMSVLKELKGIDALELRDNMLIDRISTNSSGKIPKSLVVFDKRFKKIKHILNRSEDTVLIPNVKRFIGILYTQNKIVYVDYVDPKQDEFTLNYIDLRQFEAENEKR
ncbi:MAG: DUF4080 domain-containing protein, partial [Christensenellaceae bacterium]|nr:DUF4080 domain-containing protein [Christensenellaceae bacterium]